MSAIPDHTQFVPPTPLTARLREQVPAGGARRVLPLLAIGHLCVAVATVPITLLVTGVLLDPSAAARSIGPVGGALLLVTAQILSCWRTSALARAATGHIEVAGMARSLRRSEWTFVLTVIPAGVQWVVLMTEAPGPQPSVLFVLLTAAVLLEGGGLGWHHRRTMLLGRDGAVVAHSLPPGTGLRTRSVHVTILGTHAMIGGIAAILLVATVVAVVRDDAATPLTAATRIAAAMAATAVPLLPIPSLLRVRAAITGDILHAPSLARAMASSRRACVAAFLLTAAAIASLWTGPIRPGLAAGLFSLAIGAAGIAVSYVIELERFRLGDIPKRFRPKG